MKLWRLVPEKWASTAFTGEGARLHGGRWNSVGTPMVYLSSSLSLAALEVLVHADPEDLPDPYSACAIEVPAAVVATIEKVDPPKISPDWRSDSPPGALRSFGDTWVREARSVLVELPSVIIPSEQNFLLSPAHGDSGKLTRLSPERFTFDPRLMKP
jgi:RES domain-containing protein